MEERDRSLGPAPRRRVDQLDAVDLEMEQRLGKVGDLEADVVEAFALCSPGTDGRRSCRPSVRRARSWTPPPRGTRCGRGRARCRRWSRAPARERRAKARATSSSERTTSATWWTLPSRPMCSGRRDSGDGLGDMARSVRCRGERRRASQRRRRAGARSRRDWPGSARATTGQLASGVPAHVTVLYPFIPAARARAGRPAGPGQRSPRASTPFDIRFERVGRFPAVVYLAPEPAAPFSR